MVKPFHRLVDDVLADELWNRVLNLCELQDAVGSQGFMPRVVPEPLVATTPFENNRITLRET